MAGAGVRVQCGIDAGVQSGLVEPSSGYGNDRRKRAGVGGDVGGAVPVGFSTRTTPVALAGGSALVIGHDERADVGGLGGRSAGVCLVNRSETGPRAAHGGVGRADGGDWLLDFKDRQRGAGGHALNGGVAGDCGRGGVLVVGALAAGCQQVGPVDTGCGRRAGHHLRLSAVWFSGVPAIAVQHRFCVAGIAGGIFLSRFGRTRPGVVAVFTVGVSVSWTRLSVSDKSGN